MIVDLETTTGSPEIACDLCIVGSGAAGLTLASEMARVRLRTVIVESGGLSDEPATQALYGVDVSGLSHPGSTKGRFRVYGGSTTRWGGQALPLMPLDFERRDGVPHSGWPISYEDLVPYYARACRFLRLDDRNLDTDLFALLRTRPPDFDAHRVWYHFSKWSPRASLREEYLPRLRASERCTLLLHANATGIVLDGGLARVDTVDVRSLGGHRATVRASAYVLCAGGIETARLLLANRGQHPCGLGNEHDLVGRFFQDHPSAVVGWLRTSAPEKAQRLLNVFHHGGRKYSIRCTAAPAWQREVGALNVSMTTTFVAGDTSLQDAKDIYAAIRRRRLDGALARKLWRTARHPSRALVPAWHYLARGRTYAPGAAMWIGLTSEQEPDPESRVLLSNRTDALGMPRSDVRWRLGERTVYTMRGYARVLRDEFRRAGLGDIELGDWVLDDAQPWVEHMTDRFHHMGTTRMNDSPRLGVVDPNCRIHGLANLYVVSSAVFPTGGHSNPTLTIIALGMRLADRLERELG